MQYEKFNGISVNNIDNLLIAINSNNIDKLDYKNLKYEISKKTPKYISVAYIHIKRFGTQNTVITISRV